MSARAVLRCPIAALGLLALLGAGCQDYGLASTCTDDSQCGAGRICVDQHCQEGFRPCQDSSDCEGGMVCQADGRCGNCSLDTDCPEGLLCREGLCTSEECATDEDCPEGQVCLESACRACDCQADEDCGLFEVCQDCACTTQTRPCESQADCLPFELCVEGACTLPSRCTADAECPAGQVCNGWFCELGCAADEDCGQLRACVEGRCLLRCLTDQTCFQAGTICVDYLCVPAECQADTDCAGELMRCQAGRCEGYTPCQADADCPDWNFTCQAGRCEELPTCSLDGACGVGATCEDGHCHPAAGCLAEEDCGPDQDCVAGLCRPHVCRGPADCQAPLVCSGGACVEPGNPSSVYEVLVLTPGGPIRPDQRVRLEALALNQAGQAVPGITFAWDSSDPPRGAIEVQELVGGTEAGATLVTAEAVGTDRRSRPVTFTNVLEPAADSLRVTVVAAVGRRPIAGAAVLLVADGLTQEIETDALGAATFLAPTGPADVHVFHAEYDWVSVAGSAARDLLVALPPRTGAATAGGFSGQMTFPGVGPLAMGLAGTSLSGDLLAIDFSALLGPTYQVEVNLLGQVFDLPLPAHMSLGLELQGLPITVKPGYDVTGPAGLRNAWALGGKVELSVLGELLGGIGSLEELVLALFPAFSALQHGLRPAFEVFPLPLVADADDRDRDGDLVELRPDWDNLPDLDLAPDQPQTLALEVRTPQPPSLDGAPLSTVVVVAGGFSGLGFTPLGLSAGQASGAGAELVMRLAPAHDGLEVGAYGVLALAMPTGTGLATPEDTAAVMFVAADLPTAVTFEPGFLPFPESASWDVATRELVTGAVAGAGLHRLELDAPAGRWLVYLPAADLVQVSLPLPPQGFEDRATGATASLAAIALVGGLDFEALVGFDGDDLDRLSELVRAYSRRTLP
jgi:Cys-rich repeat protein